MSRPNVCHPNVMLITAIVFLTGAAATDSQSLDLLRLIDKPWLAGSQIWNQHPHYAPALPNSHRLFDPQKYYNRVIYEPQKATMESREGYNEDDDDFMDNANENLLRMGSEKRSAVATALNAGRRRRQPAPALGKAVTPYVGVGVLNDVGQFFDSLRDNLEVLASLSPQQRASLLHETPNVVHAPSSGSGGGSGMRRLHALRPLRPTGNIRSYNRRSFVEMDGGYPGANSHDPGLLWTGLGR